jgi:Flp pilus assembly pilin Flp
MQFSKRITKNQRGQGVMEYIILTGLVGIFCLGAVKKFGSSLETRMNQINKKIVKQIEIK